MKLTGNKILITGGASGIGFALAGRFIDEGNEVLICGRNQSALNAAAEKLPSLVTMQCDLTLPGDRENLMKWIKSEHEDLNVLINNAGIQQWMMVTDKDFAKRASDEIAINIEAPVHLIHLFLGLPSASVIINITSGLAFAPLTTVPVYSATKAFFHSLTLSLRHLLKPRNIEVIELIPPALNTDLGGKGLHDFAPPVSGFIDEVFRKLKSESDTITYGFTEAILNAGPKELEAAFARMNPLKET